jgi:carbonic anhydrase
MLKKTLPALAAIPALLVFASCKPLGSTHASSAAPGHERHWSYETAGDAVGPEDWGSLPDGATCGTGTEQSPIALASAAAKPTESTLSFAYRPTQLRITNNGHTEQVDAGLGSRLEIDGKPLQLLQYHFHAPSEHTLDGTLYSMEMHLVHAGTDGKPAAVVAVLIKRGAPSKALEPFFSHLPGAQGISTPAAFTIDPAAILPASHAFLHYAGSLTTPPCSEGLRWYVLTTPVTASEEQIEAYRAKGLEGTSRPLQPLGARTLYAGGTH